MGSIKIGVVVSQFNIEITHKLEAGALDELKRHGITSDQITLVHVPGALEIPLAVKALFEQNHHGVVAIGCVVRGETSHYDYVCAGVERGCSELQLKYMRPVGFGVITTENWEQALQRAGGCYGNKGSEAALVTLKMIQVLKQIDKKSYHHHIEIEKHLIEGGISDV